MTDRGNWFFIRFGKRQDWDNGTQDCVRGGMSTIPACNAVRYGLLHIIDFCHAPFILRLAFEGTRTRRRSVSAKCIWIRMDTSFSLFHFEDCRGLALKIFTIMKTQHRVCMRPLFLVVCTKVTILKRILILFSNFYSKLIITEF